MMDMLVIGGLFILLAAFTIISILFGDPGEKGDY